MSVQWKSFFQRIPQVLVCCEIFSVAPVPPGPVENVVLTFVETLLQDCQHIVTLRYNWTSPILRGEGINGFQIWLKREPAPTMVAERSLQEVGANHQSAETQAVFQATADNFNLYLQVIPIYITPPPPRNILCQPHSLSLVCIKLLWMQIRPTSANTFGNWSRPLIIPLYGMCLYMIVYYN